MTDLEGHRLSANATVRGALIGAGGALAAAALALVVPKFQSELRGTVLVPPVAPGSTSAPAPAPAPPAPPVIIKLPCDGIDSRRRYQLYSGDVLAAFEADAALLRNNHLPAEIYSLRPSANSKAPYALALPALSQIEGDAALARLRAAGAWTKTATGLELDPRSSYARRLYPPPCDVPMLGCSANPPTEAVVAAGKWSWRENDRDCECRERPRWLEQWGAHSQCAMSCRKQKDGCEHGCDTAAPECKAGCRAARDTCLASCTSP